MIKIRNNNYELQTNNRDAFDLDILLEKVTDYFDDFDYIVGDYAYGKLRLKGFNNKSNKNFNKINDISNLDDYLLNECAYGCKYFVLKKING